VDFSAHNLTSADAPIDVAVPASYASPSPSRSDTG